MKIKYYRHMKTDEIVYEEEAESYVLDKLGITITPKGKHGEMTQEQIANIQETTEWYFSSNWIKEEIEEARTDREDIEDINYEYELERKWGIA